MFKTFTVVSNRRIFFSNIDRKTGWDRGIRIERIISRQYEYITRWKVCKAEKGPWEDLAVKNKLKQTKNP